MILLLIAAMSFPACQGELVPAEDTGRKEQPSEPEAQDKLTFGINVDDITPETAAIKIVPSDETRPYFFDCVTRKEYDAWGGDGNTIAQNLDYIVRAIEIFAIQGYDYSYDFFTKKGIYEKSLSDLLPETEYVAFAFGLDDDGTVISTLETEHFTTERYAPEPVDMTFVITPSSIKFNGAVVHFVPSDKKQPYFTDIMDYATYSGFDSDEELTGHVISEAGDLRPFLTAGDHDVDATKYLASGTRYVAYCFGYNKGVTTRVFSQEFTTPPLKTGSQAALIVKYKVEDGSPYGYPEKAVITVTLKRNELASTWYLGITGDDLSGMEENGIIEWLASRGYENADKKTFAVDLGMKLNIAAVAFGSDGAAGRLVQETVEIPGNY